MSLSPRARLFSVPSFSAKQELKHTEFKLPPQIQSRVAHHPNQKMMSDFAISKIKTAVLKIIEEEQSSYKSQHPDATQSDLDKLKYRRFPKAEIEAALGETGMAELKDELVNGRLPYSVYHAKISKNATEKEIFAFINKGLKELIEVAKKEGQTQITIEANFFGVGGMGVVKAMQDMDNASRCYALKIIRKRPSSEEHKPSEEYVHAAQAGLALARYFRPSPSHNGEVQEEIVMEYIPGIDLKTFFDPLRKIGSKEPPGSNLRPLELLILLQKMAIEVVESVHLFGAIHRDIKLSNFIYDPDTGIVKLVDFGIAVTPDRKSEGIYDDPHGTGTPGYIAPEAIFADSYSQKSDVFALGTAMALMLDMIDTTGLDDDNPLALYFTPYKLSATITPAFMKKIPDEDVRSYLVTLLLMMKERELKMDLSSELTKTQEDEFAQEIALMPMLRPTVVECIEVLENIIKLQRAIDMQAERGVYKSKIEALLNDLKQKYSEPNLNTLESPKDKVHSQSH